MLPGFRYNEARSFIEGGLQDFSISRAGQPWGIPIPWDTSQVAYVWADALVNYLSALTYARPGEDLVPRSGRTSGTCSAKDILRFHCVYWPAMLLSAGYEPPKQLFVHGFLLLDDRKISKSLGNVIDPLDLIDVYGADAVRFWAARAVSFGQDGSASIDGIRERYERELGERPRQPPLADDRDDRALPRTAAIVARPDGGLSVAAALADARRTMSRPGSTATTSPARSSGSGRSCARSTGTSRRTAPWQLAKDEARAGELDRDALRPRRRAARGRGRARAVPPGDARRGSSRRSASPWTSRGRTSPTGDAVAAEGIAPAPPLFPRIDPPTAAA